MKIVADTSALLSLAMTTLLENSLKLLEVCTTKEIEVELKELGKYADQEGKAAATLLNTINSRRIRVINVRRQHKIEELITADINHGEASCFIACLEHGISTILIDDANAIHSLENIAEAKKIKLKLSVAVLVELLNKGVITKNKAKLAIRKMIETRGWEGGALEVLIKKHLKDVFRY